MHSVEYLILLAFNLPVTNIPTDLVICILSKTIEGYGFYFDFIAKRIISSTQIIDRNVAEPSLCKQSINFSVACERFSQYCRNYGTPLKLKFPLLHTLPNSVISPL